MLVEAPKKRPNAVAPVGRASEPSISPLDTVAERSGIRWVSDADATRPGRTAASLTQLDGPMLLIAGGRGGDHPLGLWAGSVATRANYVLLYGAAAEAMAGALSRQGDSSTIVRCADLDDAVSAAAHLARRGDTVLFSPGCHPESRFRPTPAERFRDLVTMPRSARAAAA